jgi:hypothetical protein
MQLTRFLRFLLPVVCVATTHAASPAVSFDARSARSGKWSDAGTWVNKRVPRAGNNVQVRTGHVVTYDANSDAAVRVLHVAGTLTFARDKSTRLNVGLLKVLPGEECSEDGFNCHEKTDAAEPADRTDGTPDRATLEIGTRENPIPAGITATIRLTYFEGMDTNALPALMNCGGRMDIHGAPMDRTWVKLGATAKAGDSKVTLEMPLTPTPLPLKEEYKVKLLNVQSKYNLLVHWGCETIRPFDNALSNSSSVCVSGSLLRISAHGIGDAPPISPANAN